MMRTSFQGADMFGRQVNAIMGNDQSIIIAQRGKKGGLVTVSLDADSAKRLAEWIRDAIHGDLMDEANQLIARMGTGPR